jgi:enoyl-CoA hydratase/carnithine racemase
MTGDPIPAARAYDLGLVNRVVPADKVVDEAVALADRIAENSPTAVRLARRLVLDAVDLTMAEAWERTNELAVGVFQSGDAIEGSTAFAEKRPPKWGDPPD